MSIYLIKAWTRNKISSFNFDLNDEDWFTEISTTVFYPIGIIADVYSQLIHTKRMIGLFPIQKAVVLSVHNLSVIQAIHGHLPEHHINACWSQTAHADQDTAFCYSLSTQYQRIFENFRSTIVNRALIFSCQHVPSSPSMSTSITAASIPSSTPFSFPSFPTSPLTFAKLWKMW